MTTPPTPPEGGTPRTDKAAYTVMSVGAEGDPSYNAHEAADIEVCRQLERELTAKTAKCERLRQQLAEARNAAQRALNELGVPQPGYPQPVANAVEILTSALKSSGKADSEGKVG